MTRTQQELKDRYFYLWIGVTSVVMLVAVVGYFMTLNQVAKIVILSVPAVFMAGYYVGNLYFQHKQHDARNN
jgi:hypothetical protein